MKCFGLENVKAFKNTGDIELAPITLFVGQNSCGKSTIVRFPMVLAQSPKPWEMPLCLHSSNKDCIDYGNFTDVLHNNRGESFSFKCRYRYEDIYAKTDHMEYGIIPFNDLKTKFDVGIKVSFSNKKTKNAEIVIGRTEVYFGDNCAFFFERIDEKQYRFVQKIMIHKGNLISVNHEFTVSSEYVDKFDGVAVKKEEKTREIIEYHCGPISFSQKMKMSNEINLLYENEELIDYIFGGHEEKPSVASYEKDELALFKMIEGDDFSHEDRVKVCELFFVDKGFRQAVIIHDILLNMANDEFSRVYYIGPFRKNPERVYREEDVSDKVGINGENTSSILISNYKGNGKIISNVSTWFSKVFNYSIEVQALKKGSSNSGYYEIGFRDTKKRIKNIMDVGYGISQILPIVTQIEQVREFGDHSKKSMFIFEQPELHLHPNAQADLASLFASLASEPYCDCNTLLIETHSEHLIRGLQLLIADEKSPYHISAEKVRIYYVHGNDENNSNRGSWIEEMKLNEYGEFLEEWPSGFFDKAYTLASDMLSAVNQRKYDERRMKNEKMEFDS